MKYGNYSCFYEPKYDLKIMKPLYLKWNKYIKEEYSKQGLKILYKTLDNMDEFFNAPKSNDSINKSQKEGIKSLDYSENLNRKIFYDILFEKLEKILVPYKDAKPENLKFIYAITKLITYEGNKNYIFKIYQKSQKDDEENIKRKNMFSDIINKIMDNIFCINELKKQFELEYVNALIILLESFGEYKNEYLNEIMFKNNEKNKKTIFEKLIEAFIQTYLNFNKIEDDENYDDKKKSTLIIFNSLTNCIIEFIENSDLNERIFLNQIDIYDKDVTIQYLIFCKLSFFDNIENLEFLYFILGNYSLFELYLTKSLKFKNKNEYIIEKISSSCETTLIYMNWCFKKILSLLNISLTSSKDKNNNKDLNKYVTYIKNGHYYFDINDYNDESEDFTWQKDIISNVDNLL